MFVEAGSVAEGSRLQFDVCIVGAGAAGICVALELEHAGARVCLLEAGGLSYEPGTQDLLQGEVTGEPYPDLRQTRLAALGGATKLWAGWCRPLDEIDFEPRSWVGDSGWPFPRSSLLPAYERAHEWCGLGPFDYEPDAWEAADVRRLPLRHDDLATSVFQVSKVRFGDRYATRLRNSASITVLLHAPVVGCCAAGTSDRIDCVRVATLEGRRFDVAARLVVLAAGGIENARLLLLSGDSPATSVGNAHGLVGRYFNEHAFCDPGICVFTGGAPTLDFYFSHANPRWAGDAAGRAAFSLSRPALEREGALNSAVFFHPPYAAHPVFESPDVRAALEAWEVMRGRGVPGRLRQDLASALRSPLRVLHAALRRASVKTDSSRMRLRAFCECEPRRENSVTLSTRRDALGRPLPLVQWRMGDNDIRSLELAVRTLDDALRRSNLGSLQGLPADGAGWRAAVVGGKHQMGTTRMHADPRRGVVDADGRVHGVTNLFVTGSSVFPTYGFANPTLTIVALAVRLAGHLRRELQ